MILKEFCTFLLSIITSYTVLLPKYKFQNHNATPYISRLAKALIALQTILLMLDFDFGFEEKRNTT